MPKKTEPKIKKVDIKELTGWEKNPRTIDEKQLERLKSQIKKLGVYKPLLVNQDMIVLGGNQRLKAYKEIGIKNVHVSVVETENEKEMLEYALSDNDRMGDYDEEAVGRMTLEVEDIDLELFRIDTGYTTSLETMNERYKMLYQDNDSEPYAPDDLEEREADESTVQQDKEVFENATIKQIVLYFSGEDYNRTIEKLDRIADIEGLENNTEVFNFLLNSYE